jgi:branched-chain amino acid transport system ATP-binding protein
VLVVKDMVVRYGPVTAVRGISFEVRQGEVVGLIGPNGAGKSTTLNTIAGAVPLAAGQVEFEGSSIAGNLPEAIVRAGIALVPEGRRIFATLTVEENLRLGATVRSDRSGVEKDLADSFSRFPILEAYRSMPAGRLSGGEQQQLAIARALLSRPKLVLLDEPSLGLAPLIVEAVFDTLAELRDQGVTLLLVEQNALAAVEFADRTYVLRNGSIGLEGTREELLASSELESAYLGFEAATR